MTLGTIGKAIRRLDSHYRISRERKDKMRKRECVDFASESARKIFVD